MGPLAKAAVALVLETALGFVRRELENPDGWESDPRTRTIRRKGRGRARARARSKPDAEDPSVLDVCGRCGRILPGQLEGVSEVCRCG